MIFWKDIVFPIVLAILAIGLIIFLLNLILRFFRIDIPILKVIALFAIWYYVGPIIYEWLLYKVITVPNEGIEIIYTPIQSIIEVFEKLV